MTVLEIKKYIMDSLTPAVGRREAAAMARDIFESVMALTDVDVVLHANRIAEPETVSIIIHVVERVAAGEPLQYVLGHARFMGMKFKVTAATLIPRPETAQLVDLITDRFSGVRDLDILDICTGSGCIAIALSRALPFASVTGTDISGDALVVARENAAVMAPTVRFRQEDALHLTPGDDSEMFDIIVSNPPYVAPDEAAAMDARVLDFEPRQAIFAPEGQPLVFYKAIAAYAVNALKPNGALFFEINPRFVPQLEALLHSLGFGNVSIIRDFDARNRFAVCQI